MIKVGLTGGIGSGKTTVAKVFETLGTPVYYADDKTKHLMNTNALLKDSLIQHFGNDVYQNGKLDRKYLAAIVFNDKEKLELLNFITHPITIQDAEEWMNQQTTPYIIKEAALLFESGAAEKLDFVIGVYAPPAMRIQRVMQRDKLPAEEVMKRINGQMVEEMKMKLCHFVIVNNGEQLVIPQVLQLDKKFREISTQ